jgi:hypothetical protein
MTRQFVPAAPSNVSFSPALGMAGVSGTVGAETVIVVRLRVKMSFPAVPITASVSVPTPSA